MKARILAVASVAAMLGVAPAIAWQQPPPGGEAAMFDGSWTVTGVAVPDEGVQALAEDDPSLMGRRLSFSPARLAWDRPTATADACVGPRFTRLGTPAPTALRSRLLKLGLPRPTPFAIRCRSGSWGPGGDPMVFRGAGGVLAMPWYDGGVLRLSRR